MSNGNARPKTVTIHYFKPSGKWYTDDEVVWPVDPSHYDGYAPFETLHRIKSMYAVCIDAPQGYPQFSNPIVKE